MTKTWIFRNVLTGLQKTLPKTLAALQHSVYVHLPDINIKASTIEGLPFWCGVHWIMECTFMCIYISFWSALPNCTKFFLSNYII